MKKTNLNPKIYDCMTEEEKANVDPEQLKMGTEIEAEHGETYDFIKDYLKEHDKLPSETDVYMHIALNHLEGTEDEKGIIDYYTRLKDMEKKAKTEGSVNESWNDEDYVSD